MTTPNAELRDRFATLSTALVADACLRLGRDARCAPPDLLPLLPGKPIAGRALPVRHHGSVDVFLEALEGAQTGDVLAIDNEGRSDEACIGDLVALEAQGAGLAGIVAWGMVRDVAELVAIGLPIYGTGRCPMGPRALRARPRRPPADAQLGAARVTRDDVIFADDDGVLVVEGADLGALLDAASEIARRERAQAQRARAGESLRRQLRFEEYLAARALDPRLTFREHLVRLGGAVEV